MARTKKQIGMDGINKQIEEAQKEVVSTKRKYDAATERLKVLLAKRKELQAEEVMDAIMKSSHSYDEILRYIKSSPDEVE